MWVFANVQRWQQVKALAPCYHLHKPALTVVIIVASCSYSSDLASSHHSHRTFSKRQIYYLWFDQLSTFSNRLHWNQKLMRVSSFKVLYFISVEPCPPWRCFLHKLLCCVYHFESETWSWEKTKKNLTENWNKLTSVMGSMRWAIYFLLLCFPSVAEDT